MGDLAEAFVSEFLPATLVVVTWLPLLGFLYLVFKVSLYAVRCFTPVKKRQSVDSGINKKVKGTGVAIPCVNPATGESYTPVNAYTKEDVEKCINRAKKAQEEWKETSFDERRAVLQDLIDYVLEHRKEIAAMSVEDSGKTLMEAEFGEILTTCEKLRYVIAKGEEAIAPSTRHPPLLMFLKKGWVEYHPLGVIGIIIPWNYPFHNIASHVTTALFTGNSAVVKVSEWSSHSKDLFENIFREVLSKRGHNPDLVQIVTGYGDTGAALIGGGVDKVLFIGSPSTGKKVMETASRTLTPVVLELGGKDPFIVFDDAEFDQAVSAAVRGCFINNGCNCIASERLYIQSGVFDKFKKAVVEKVGSLRQGASGKEVVDVGAITMPRQVDIVEDLVNDAVSNGAVVETGGKRLTTRKGNFFAPTVLSNVSHNLRIVNEEVFGPVMLLIKFDTEDELIKMVNSSEFGLGSSVFTTDYAKADRITHLIESGMTTVNDFGVSYMLQGLPFGGCKKSGFGVFNGPEGLREFCRAKSVVTDRFPVRTHVPGFTEYPIPAAGPDIVGSACAMIYHSSPADRIKGLYRMLKLILTAK